MMLGTELRSRDLPRATVRYDDLLVDWRSAMTQADETIRMGLFDRATPEQIADAGDLVDPTLHRSTAEWDELELPPRLLDLATRTYDTYGRLVGVPAAEQGETRARARRDPGRAHGVLRRVLRRGPHPHRRQRAAREAQGRTPRARGDAGRRSRRAASPRSAGPCGASCGDARERGRCPAGRGAPGRRGRHARRSRHPQAADQDRRQDDPRAHACRLPGPPDGRRDRGDDGRGSPRRGARDGAHGRVRQGHPGPRRRRHPQRDDAQGPRAPARGLPGALPRRRAADGQRADHHRVLRGARELRRRRRCDRVGRHDHRGLARRQHDPGHPAARQPAPRADPAGVPGLGPPGGVRRGGTGPRFHRHRRLRRGAEVPPRRPDLGGRGRGAQHEGDRPDRRVPRRQALPADQHLHARGAQRRGVPRHPGRQGDRGARGQLRHRRRHRHRGPRARRDRGDVQPLQHQHPRRAALRPGRRRRSR